MTELVSDYPNMFNLRISFQTVQLVGMATTASTDAAAVHLSIRLCIIRATELGSVLMDALCGGQATNASKK